MTVLRGLTWAHPRGHDALLGPSRAWMARHPGVDVVWEARSLHAFGDDSLAARAEQYDLLVIDHPHIPDAHDEGWLRALDGVGRDDTLDVLAGQSVGRSHASYEYAGHQYGLAIDAATQVAVARADRLPTPPADWDEVTDLARRGRVLWPLKPVNAMASLLTFLGQRGHALEHGFDAAATEDSLERMRELAALVPRFCLDDTPIDTAERLVAADEWWYAPLAYGYTNYSRSGFRGTRLIYRDIPALAGSIAGSCLGGAGIAVSAHTAERDLATDLAFWLADAETQRGEYFASGGQPANAVAWDDETCNAATLDFFRGTRATIEAASVRPRFVDWMSAQVPIGETVHAYLAGATDTARAVDGIRTALDAALERAARHEEAR